MAAPPRVRRTVRDWLADIFISVAAVLIGIVTYEEGSSAGNPSEHLLALDFITGVAACLLLWLRRRWPVQVVVAASLMSTFSEAASGAAVLAVFSVAIHRPFRVTALVGSLSLLTLPVYAFIYTSTRPTVPSSDVLAAIVSAVVIYIGVAGWGFFIRSRRQLLMSLRERADRAETVARLQAEQAQLLAREEIAREMHDVLGHRLSLLSVHAGALAYRPGAPTEEVAGAAEIIRASAHQALQDLREVIGVLRAPVGELPQPTFADLPELIEGARRAGMKVGLSVDAAGNIPDHLGRTAYRIVQEGLTNALKHAPGTPVRVRVTGAPGNGLTVELLNPAPAGVGAGNGKGLIGLGERATLVNGRLEHGRTAEGDFRLSAWLPWPA